jgi:hypothetical protein
MYQAVMRRPLLAISPRFIKSQRIGDSSIPDIGVAVDMPVGINDLEARVYRFNGPWCWEAFYGPLFVTW